MSTPTGDALKTHDEWSMVEVSRSRDDGRGVPVNGVPVVLVVWAFLRWRSTLRCAARWRAALLALWVLLRRGIRVAPLLLMSV